MAQNLNKGVNSGKAADELSEVNEKEVFEEEDYNGQQAITGKQNNDNKKHNLTTKNGK